MINKKKLIPGIIVVFSFILALILIGLRPEAGASKRQYIPPLVNTMMVEPTDIQVIVKSQGSVIPRTEINLTSEIAGRVLWVAEKLSDGATFSQGDTLLKLDPRDYELALISAQSN